MAGKRLPRTFRRKSLVLDRNTGIGKPSVIHALIIIFLEFFAWGLLTTPMLTVTSDTFQEHSFLMNGLVFGVKGFLSFLAGPLIGALSDTYGRKAFLLITVFFTCLPIPIMVISPMWFFALISLSGCFAVTYTVIFAYVADVTSVEERTTACGIVSATFAASLITSPAIGAYIAAVYSIKIVVIVASAIAILDIFFIMVAVPESLSVDIQKSSRDKSFTWSEVNPFGSMGKIGQDRTLMLVCIAVFLSYLPECGQYSSFFIYLKQMIRFTSEDVSVFIAMVGIIMVFSQTVLLSFLKRMVGSKRTILLGLFFQILQLFWFAVSKARWMIWSAGILAGLSSMTFPAISAMVSQSADPENQGIVQGMITGVRSLCIGLGPALFGLIFFAFGINVYEHDTILPTPNVSVDSYLVPGPPFGIGALIVIAAFLVASVMPESLSNRFITSKLVRSNKRNLSKSSTTPSDSEDHLDIAPLIQLTDDVEN